MSYQSLFAKKQNHPEMQKEIEANKRVALRRQPAEGDVQGISVKEAASRLGVSVSTIYRRLRAGKFQSAFKSASKAGGRQVLWISGVEIFNLSNVQIIYRESDLH